MPSHKLTTKETQGIKKEAGLSDPRILRVAHKRIIGGTVVDYLLEAYDDISCPWRGWYRDGESISDIHWDDENVSGWLEEFRP